MCRIKVREECRKFMKFQNRILTFTSIFDMKHDQSQYYLNFSISYKKPIIEKWSKWNDLQFKSINRLSSDIFWHETIRQRRIQKRLVQLKKEVQNISSFDIYKSLILYLALFNYSTLVLSSRVTWSPLTLTSHDDRSLPVNLSPSHSTIQRGLVMVCIKRALSWSLCMQWL